jgi:hypothetical protein
MTQTSSSATFSPANTGVVQAQRQPWTRRHEQRASRIQSAVHTLAVDASPAERTATTTITRAHLLGLWAPGELSRLLALGTVTEVAEVAYTRLRRLAHA